METSVAIHQLKKILIWGKTYPELTPGPTAT
jgi:hypothetical protein